MTTDTTIRRLLVLGGLLSPLLGVTGCPEEPTDGDGDADADGDGDGDADSDLECTPRSCMDIDRACGTYDDGCGGTIECLRGCECTAETFAEDCPERPCETAVGCEENRCVYDAVSCGGAACACRAPECGAWTLRSCGEGACTPSFCDPRPVQEDGVARYENACVEAPAVGACGTCGLGRLECDEATDTFSCLDIVLVGVDPAMVECNSALPTSSFVFVDPDYDGDASDGSRARPYASCDEGISVAWGRDSVGVVVAGSEVFRGALTLFEGVSVYGGFEGAPHFRVNGGARPVFEVGLEHATGEDLAARRLVGARAHGFVEPTVLSGLAIRTDSLAEVEPHGPGLSNYGLHVQGSPGLHLVNVIVEAGAAGPGEAGAAGDAGPAGAAGAPGAAAIDCACGAGLSGHEACYGTTTAGGAAAGVNRCLDFTTPPETAGGAGGGVTFASTGCEFPFFCSGPGASSPSGAAGGEFAYWSGGQPGSQGEAASAERPLQAAPGALPAGPSELDGEIFFVASPAGDGGRGARGTHGAGAGGGSSGSHDDHPSTVNTEPFSARTCTGLVVGGGGGGGGAGGCGGDGGGGGRSGGVSIALLVADSDGMVLDGCELRAGAAGDGGQGGEGGGGGPGGGGGGPGTIAPATCTALGESCGRVAAGSGGHGGAGQPGGHGGNGAGGSSYGAYCVETTLELRRASSFLGREAGAGGTFGTRPAPGGESVDQHACVSDCGNGTIEPPEQCDDGNREDGDGCEADCTLVCGAAAGAIRASRDSARRCLAGFAEPLGWEAAELACITAGGHLASLTNAADFATASTLFAGTSHWVGLNDRAVDGTYLWPSGESLSFPEGFCTGEPRESETDDCVMAFWSRPTSSHCWMVRACDISLPYLCELP